MWPLDPSKRSRVRRLGEWSWLLALLCVLGLGYFVGVSQYVKPWQAQAQTITARPYWIVGPMEYATVGSPHTHIQVTGWVAYTRWEDDGDLHIKVVPTRGAYTPFF